MYFIYQKKTPNKPMFPSQCEPHGWHLPRSNVPADGKLLFLWFIGVIYTGVGQEKRCREQGKGEQHFPLPLFSLFDICHYHVTLFGASKVVGSKLGGSPALLLWKSQRVANNYQVLKDFLLGHVPHVWSSNCSRCA